jgi:hypothetical protein
MSQRRKTVPPTRVSPRSSRIRRSELIAREKNEKQSAKERTALDNRFYRTYHAFSRERPPRANGRAARRLPQADESAICSRRDAVQAAMQQALQRRGCERPLVSCYAELARARGSRFDDSTSTRIERRLQ